MAIVYTCKGNLLDPIHTFFLLPLWFPQVNNCILLIPRTSLPPLSFSNKIVQLHFLSSYYVPGIMLGAADIETIIHLYIHSHLA